MNEFQVKFGCSLLPVTMRFHNQLNDEPCLPYRNATSRSVSNGWQTERYG
jgi:hypothetical protein